jgi:hypothetical protein
VTAEGPIYPVEDWIKALNFELSTIQRDLAALNGRVEMLSANQIPAVLKALRALSEGGRDGPKQPLAAPSTPWPGHGERQL